MATGPHDAWKRLGDLLIQRRIELSPRYRVRTVFAEETGLHWRMLYDIERGKRANFPDETLAAIEVAYRWQPGSIRAVLAGGEPSPVQPPGSDRREAARRAEEFLAGLTEEDRQQLADDFIKAIRSRAARDERPTGTNGG